MSQGDEHAADHLVPYLYTQLHEMAQSFLRKERPGHTL